MDEENDSSTWRFNCRSPVPDQQPSLFSDPSEKVLAELRISSDELAHWREMGWTDLSASDKIEWGEQNELIFLRDVTRSGLNGAQIDVLLKQLPKPYRFSNPDYVAYSFSSGWMEVTRIPEPEPAEEVEGYIEQLKENEDWEELERLRDEIEETLKSREEGDE